MGPRFTAADSQAWNILAPGTMTPPGEEGARLWPHVGRDGHKGQGPREPPAPGFARKSDPDLDLNEMILDIRH